MKNQFDINSVMRSILIDWMTKVCKKFKFDQKTLYLSVNILDRFLSIKNIQRTNLQLIGITSLLISSKFEEDYHGAISDFVNVTAITYTKSDIIKMECEILSTLNFDISRPTAIDFLHEYLIDNPHEIKTYLCNFYLELTLQHYKFISFRPSDIALTLVYFINKKLKYIIDDENTSYNCYIFNMFNDLLNEIHSGINIIENYSIINTYQYSKEIFDNDSDNDDESDSDDDESDTIRRYNNSIGITS